MSEDWSYRDVGWRAMQLDPSFRPNSVRYSDIRCRQLEGTFPGDAMSGVWQVSAARILRGWGAVTEDDWPYVGSPPNWPPSEPPGLDDLAKPRRCQHYQRVRSARECCRLLGRLIAVAASFEITDQWFNALDGVITLPASTDEIVGSHCISICGFDMQMLAFRFQNSWGDKWGVQGFGYLPFEFFDRYLVESWVPQLLGQFPDWFKTKEVDSLSWRVRDFIGHSSTGGDVLHGLEIYDGTRDERQGWAFAVHRDGHLDIEELFVRPDCRQQGIGRHLVEGLLQMKAKLNLPMRLWIPWADWEPALEPRVRRVVELLGLSLQPTNVRWAAMLATATASGVAPQGVPQPPSRPRLWPDALRKV